MKQEAAGSGKRHDVRSIIASSPRSYHNTPSHLEMRAERGRYEEAPKGRPSAVVSTASPIARSSPLTLGSEQGGKAHHSPVGYEDKGGLRAPYPGPSHRGSPLSREASQRQHDGGYISSQSSWLPLFVCEKSAWFLLHSSPQKDRTWNSFVSLFLLQVPVRIRPRSVKPHQPPGKWVLPNHHSRVLQINRPMSVCCRVWELQKCTVKSP